MDRFKVDKAKSQLRGNVNYSTGLQRDKLCKEKNTDLAVQVQRPLDILCGQSRVVLDSVKSKNLEV